MTTGRTPLIDSLKALVAAGTNKGRFMDSRSGSLINQWGTQVFTPTGGARLQRNGGACTVLGTDYFTHTLVQSGTELSMGVYFFRDNQLPSGSGLRPVSISASVGTHYLLVSKSNDRITGGFQFSGGVLIPASSAAFAVPANTKAHIAVSMRENNADGVRLYLNGVAHTHANLDTTGQTISHGPGILQTPIGSGSTSSMGGDFYVVLEINKYLTTAEHAQIYDEIVNQLKYETNNLIINKDYPTIGTSVWEARYGLLAGEQTMSAGQSLGQLDPLKVSTGTHKATTFLYNGVLAKGIKCVTAGNVILPDPRPTLGTTWAYRYYDDSAGTWESRTSATATVALDAVNDIILWATADGRTCLRKY